MNKFLIITNRSKDPDEKIANSIKDYVKDKYPNSFVNLASVERITGRFKFTNPDKVDKDTDIVIAVGGDGTILQAARDLSGLDIPFIGVNMGTLGYLSEVYPKDYSDMVDKLVVDEYSLEKRMMISGEVSGKIKGVSLNDIVIRRAAGMVKLGLSVNGKFLTSYYADGVIISTPTGSTAYNLSAGGPIVDPQAEIMIVTPMYPHTINTRPIVLSAHDEISIEILDIRGNKGECDILFDGDLISEIKTGDLIKVNKSERTTEIIKLNNQSFIEVLKEKMGDNIIWKAVDTKKYWNL